MTIEPVEDGDKHKKCVARIAWCISKCGGKKGCFFEIVGALAAILGIWAFVVSPSTSARVNSEMAIDALAAYEADTGRAQEVLDRVSVSRRNNRFFLLARGLLALQSSGELGTRGKNDLMEAARRLRRDARPHFVLGVTYMRGQAACEAIAEFRKAISRQRGFGPSKSQLGAAIIVAKYYETECGGAARHGSVDVDSAIEMVRSAAESQESGGASQYYQLADSLMVASRMTVDREQRGKYVDQAEGALTSAIRRDQSSERAARMRARWDIVNRRWREARQKLEGVQGGLWSVYDAIVVEYCVFGNTTRARSLLDTWKRWAVESREMPLLAGSRMEDLRTVIEGDDGGTERACDEIMVGSSPLLWSASQAVAAMGEWAGDE